MVRRPSKWVACPACNICGVTAHPAIVRAERSEDHAAIRLVNAAAFGQPDEAVLVDALRAAGVLLLSLVAKVDVVSAATFSSAG